MSFKGETKNIFHQFERASTCQKLSQTWEPALKNSKKTRKESWH